MAGRAYERLEIEFFGRHLILSRDLDPIYVALHSMRSESAFEDAAHCSRWLIAYWCFYHAGVASFLSEKSGSDFWRYMALAAANESGEGTCPVPPPAGAVNGGWPRGSERRHFRGAQARSAVQELAGRYKGRPEDMVAKILDGPRDYAAVAKRVQEHRGFGAWISFKVGDMLDRVLGERVDFSQAQVFMFKDPVEAAIMLWRTKEGLSESSRPKSLEAQNRIISSIVNYLEEQFDGLDAPPANDRPIGLQEIETVLCKWKSHMRGHYPLWNDTDEILHGLLEAWESKSATGGHFFRAMPKRRELEIDVPF